MQRMTGLLRRCVEDYNMIEEGDRIAIGVSGGKDSLTLLRLMAALREYYPSTLKLRRSPLTWDWKVWTFHRYRHSATN